MNALPDEGETAMEAENVPLQQLYEEIKDAPPPQATPPDTGSTVVASLRSGVGTGASVPPHPYENVAPAGLHGTGAESAGRGAYHLTLCSAYGVSLDHKEKK